MANPSFDENDLVHEIDKDLKKDGTFDKIRKQATDHIRESECVQRIEKEMLAKVDELLNSSSNLTREEITKKMREHIGNNFKMRNDINRQTRIELEKCWVRETLEKEIEEKIDRKIQDMSN